MHLAEIQIPLKITNHAGDEIEVLKCDTSILWPWDLLKWLWDSNHFLQWVSDEPSDASKQVEEYWSHCSHLEFFKKLNLDPGKLRTTVPLFFHADGVKVYKAQKCWVYSFSSATRKGASTKTKLVIILLRENRIIREKSHDAVGKLMGYICDTLMTGCFPFFDSEGNRWPVNSIEASRAGHPFAGSWQCAFAGFKGDWEARVVIHKSKRNYNSIWICDHCMASRNPQFTFGDFRLEAACLRHRFSHDEYMILQGDKQSAWRFVKGWAKGRNLEVARICLRFFHFCFTPLHPSG